MDFEAYSERLATLYKYCFDNRPKKIEQKRFLLANESVQMKSVRKNQFSELNDKRFYFHDGIVSLPFGHTLSEKTREEKEKHRNELHTFIQKRMFEFSTSESRAVHLCERLRVLRSIYAPPLSLYKLDSQVSMIFTSLESTRELILNGSWK